MWTPQSLYQLLPAGDAPTPRYTSTRTYRPFLGTLALVTVGVVTAFSFKGPLRKSFKTPSEVSAGDIDLIDLFQEPWDSAPLRDLCTATVWQPDVWFTCDNIEGGLANVQNTVLHCIRYSIGAGASFVLPTLHLRGALNNSDSDNLRQGGRAGLEFFFDVDYLKLTLSQVCPHMRLVDTVMEIPNYHSAVIPNVFLPRDLFLPSPAPGGWQPPDWNAVHTDYAERWRRGFEKWAPKASHTSPLVCRFGFPVYFEWPIVTDPVSFWQTFSRILRFRRDASTIASEIVMRVSEAYHGAHLRVEADVQTPQQQGAWGSFEGQASMIMEHAEAHGLTAIYIACGDPDAYLRFVSLAGKRSLKAISKYSLLDTRLMALVQSMAFDQQAIIDYLVMLKAAHFSGVGMSSFSQTIAIHRHLESRDHATPFAGSDERSTVWQGSAYTYFLHSVWP